MTEADRVAKIVLATAPHPPIPEDIDSLKYRVRELQATVDRFRRDAIARAYLDALIEKLDAGGALPGAQDTGIPTLSISPAGDPSARDFETLMRCAPAVAVTIQDGGLYYAPGRHSAVNAIVFADGTVWDACKGWRGVVYPPAKVAEIRAHALMSVNSLEERQRAAIASNWSAPKAR